MRAETAPRVEITNVAAQPGETLGVWVVCAKGTGAGDVRSPVTGYTVLGAQSGGEIWHATPRVAARTRSGVYGLRARCTPGPGSPYAAATMSFRVLTGPQRWVAESTTAESITGDVRFTPSVIAFTAGGHLRIRYLRDVPGSVSILGATKALEHAQLYRVLTAADLRLRSGNTLCGKPPTYLTVLRTSGALDADVILTVYSGNAEPRAESSAAICSSYTYFPKPA